MATIKYDYWSYMIKWLSSPEYYRIDKYLNNGNVNFIRSSKYARYRMCKSHSRTDLCNLVEINYYKTEYLTIEGNLNIITKSLLFPRSFEEKKRKILGFFFSWNLGFGKFFGQSLSKKFCWKAMEYLLFLETLVFLEFLDFPRKNFFRIVILI